MSTQDDALTLVARGQSLAIHTPEDYIRAAEFLKLATALDRSMAEHYKPLKQAADELHTRLVAAEREQRRPVQMVIARVEGEMIGWEDLRKQLAAAANKTAQALANDATPNGLVPQLQVTDDIPKVDGISGRSNWKAEITDASLLPREYLTPDTVKLNAAAKRMREHFNVPGARAYNDAKKIVRES